jgi:hypothetical protein
MRTATAIVIVLIIGIGMVAGQDRTPPSGKSDAKAPWSEAVDGLQCWLEPDKTDGGVPALRLHVRNQGKRDLVIHMAQAACKLELDSVWFDWVAPVSILAGTWPAGGQYQDFEVRVTLAAPWTSEGKPIDPKPGKHKVRVAYVTLDHPKPVRVESNAVEIDVVAAERKPVEERGQALRALKEEVQALRQQLEKIEKRLAEIEKQK